LSSKTTLFWASKRRRFGHFIIIFFIKKKKKEKRKRKILKKGGGGKKSGVAGATPTAGLGVVEPPPWPRGWSGHPQKPKKKKKKKTKNGFWPFGGGRTTPKDLGVDSATPKGWFGVDESTPRSLGVVRPPPKGQNPFFVFFFFFFLGFWGWPDHPLGHGGGSTTPRPAVGVAPATPWPKMGWPAIPFLAKGVAGATPDFFHTFFFFFKKKKFPFFFLFFF
jgi:hypothetical protein